MNKTIITINRECGSGGRDIACRMGEILGLKVYDKAILEAICEKYNLDERNAAKFIDDVDRARETFTKNFVGVSRYDARNYDFAINVSRFTTEEVASFLAGNLRKKMEIDKR